MNLRYEDGEIFSDVVEFHTLEIEKVPEQSDGSKIWEWAKFFVSKTKEEFTMCAEKNPEIKKAVGKLMELSEDERNFMIAEQIEKERRDRVAEIELGEERGEKRGIEKGIEQNKLETAMVMLKDHMPLDLIVKYSGLTEEQISLVQIEQ